MAPKMMPSEMVDAEKPRFETSGHMPLLPDVEVATQAARTASLLGDGEEMTPPKVKPVKKETPEESRDTGSDASTSGGKGKKPEGKGGMKNKVQCRGCRKGIDSALMGEKNVFCPDVCKKSLDRLAYVAKQEGAEAVRRLKEAC